jgi:hypothetical protein
LAQVDDGQYSDSQHNKNKCDLLCPMHGVLSKSS